MDTADYIALDQFLRRATGQPADEGRSPINLVHDVPMTPGWSTVLVYYDAVKWENGEPQWNQGKSCVTILGYCPNAEHQHRPEPRGEWNPNFQVDLIGEVHEFTGEGAHVGALAKFLEMLREYALTEADNFDLVLNTDTLELTEREDARLTQYPGGSPLPTLNTRLVDAAHPLEELTAG